MSCLSNVSTVLNFRLRPFLDLYTKDFILTIKFYGGHFHAFMCRIYMLNAAGMFSIVLMCAVLWDFSVHIKVSVHIVALFINIFSVIDKLFPSSCGVFSTGIWLICNLLLFWSQRIKLKGKLRSKNFISFFSKNWTSTIIRTQKYIFQLLIISQTKVMAF